jgi:hypothetical protein
MKSYLIHLYFKSVVINLQRSPNNTFKYCHALKANSDRKQYRITCLPIFAVAIHISSDISTENEDVIMEVHFNTFLLMLLSQSTQTIETDLCLATLATMCSIIVINTQSTQTLSNKYSRKLYK